MVSRAVKEAAKVADEVAVVDAVLKTEEFVSAGGLHLLRDEVGQGHPVAHTCPWSRSLCCDGAMVPWCVLAWTAVVRGGECWVVSQVRVCV